MSCVPGNSVDNSRIFPLVPVVHVVCFLDAWHILFGWYWQIACNIGITSRIRLPSERILMNVERTCTSVPANAKRRDDMRRMHAPATSLTPKLYAVSFSSTFCEALCTDTWHCHCVHIFDFSIMIFYSNGSRLLLLKMHSIPAPRTFLELCPVVHRNVHTHISTLGTLAQACAEKTLIIITSPHTWLLGMRCMPSPAGQSMPKPACRYDFLLVDCESAYECAPSPLDCLCEIERTRRRLKKTITTGPSSVRPLNISAHTLVQTDSCPERTSFSYKMLLYVDYTLVSLHIRHVYATD
jgi:hypothetical protein